MAVLTPEPKVAFFKSMKLSDFFKKADILLFAFLLLLGAWSILFVRLNGADGADTVKILVDGEPYCTCSLLENRRVSVRTEYGSNTVVVEDGCVYVSESDCPGHDCERFGRISTPGSMIMCIPHHLCVTIGGGGEVDAVVY